MLFFEHEDLGNVLMGLSQPAAGRAIQRGEALVVEQKKGSTGVLNMTSIICLPGNGYLNVSIPTCLIPVFHICSLGNWKKIIYAYRAELLFVFKA